MMENALRAGAIALLFTVAVGCERAEEDPLAPFQFDLSRLGAAMDSVSARLEPVAFALERVAEARSAIERDGADLDVLSIRRVPAAEAWEPAGIPQALHGAVYVRNPSTHAYERDAEREDGPFEGIRIVHYRRVSSGELLVPLSEAGSVDLTQNEAAEERFGIALRDADGNVLEEFAIEGEHTEDRRIRLIEGTMTGDPQMTFLLHSVDQSDFQVDAEDLSATIEAGPMHLYISRQAYVDRDSGEMEGGFRFELDTGVARASVETELHGSAGTPDQVEGAGYLGSEVEEWMIVGGSYADPSFSSDGSLSSADLALWRQLWSGAAAIIEAWWVPIGS